MLTTDKIERLISDVRELKDDTAEIKAELMRTRPEHESNTTVVRAVRTVSKLGGVVLGAFGAALAAFVSWQVSTTIRLEERQGVAAKTIATEQARVERVEDAVTGKLDTALETLAELRAESRATRERMERMERAIAAQDRRHR